MARYDIVIPHYGKGRATSLAIACLMSIYRAGGDYRVILIDNASPEFDALLPVLNIFDPERLLVVRATENLGFIRATNTGITMSSAPFVVFLNNDTEVTGLWLELLEECFTAHPACGLAGPLTTTPDSWQGKWKPTDPYKIHLLAPGRMLAFFCTMLSRRCLETVGLLDTGYGVGFGDDDEYCRRAEMLGFKLVLRQDLVIKHHHRSTFKLLYSPDEIASLQSAAMARFRRTAPARSPRRVGLQANILKDESAK